MTNTRQLNLLTSTIYNELERSGIPNVTARGQIYKQLYNI